MSNNLPPGVTDSMIDEFFGGDDEGTEIDLLSHKGEVFLVTGGTHSITIQHTTDDLGQLITEFVLSHGQAGALARAITERL